MRPFIARPPQTPINRREFLKWIGGAGVTLLAAACQPLAPTRTPAAFTSTPFQPSAVSIDRPSPTPLPPTATATIPPPTATPDGRTRVALGRLTTYDQSEIRSLLETMLADIGGPGDWIKPGAHVGIKVNLTGEPVFDRPDQPKSTEYYTTNPAVVGALVEIIKDLGVSKISILDGLGDPATFDKWGYTEMAKPLGAQLIDLCRAAPYGGFKVFPSVPKAFVYDRYYLHAALAEIDGLISVAKLKCHATTGVTLSMKNLIGLAPISEYVRHPQDTNRSFFHGDAAYDTRLPGVIMDLNRIMPVRLALIDGIMTAEGGAGPWQATLAPVSPGVLVAGRDPVATDAVATAVMGFDPEAAGGSLPFLHGDNHLAMAASLGLGTNRLDEIHVCGPQIVDVRYPFKPAP